MKYHPRQLFADAAHGTFGKSVREHSGDTGLTDRERHVSILILDQMGSHGPALADEGIGVGKTALHFAS